MQHCIDFLVGLAGKFVDLLDGLMVVDGVSFLTLLLGVFIILTILISVFGKGRESE